jgi:hypothetical protein
MNAKPRKPERTPIPFDDALRRILSATPKPRKAKPRQEEEAQERREVTGALGLPACSHASGFVKYIIAKRNGL